MKTILTVHPKVAIITLVDIAIFLALLYPTFTWSNALMPIVFILWAFAIVFMLISAAIVSCTKSDVETAEKNAETELRTSYNSHSHCTKH